MALGGKMDYAVHPIIAHKREHLVEVAYVGLYKKIVRSILDIFQIGQIAGICKCIDIDYAIVGILVHKRRTTWLPMNPAPPVTIMLRLKLFIYF